MARDDEQQAEEIRRLHARFEASMNRSLEERIKHGFFRTFRPVLDEGPGIRMWDTMEDYKHWCDTVLPEWLGYKRVSDEEWEEIKQKASS